MYSSSEFCYSKVQSGEPEVNLYSPQNNSFGSPARKTRKKMISSSAISSPDASCSAWFSVDHGKEPVCVYKNDKNSAKLLTNECLTNEPEVNKENFSMGLIPPAAPIKNLPGKMKNKKILPHCDVVDPSACDYWPRARCVDITVKKSKTKR